ncbi:MAG: hypothetical protein SFV17_04180 [Candidatus Obscuribacter sp.]|nr:hypothetical protein [Candidatus Melainabacteria bacterium]MDX1985866.1 hypothetical protein [Candidatus Obscuribacter sp.]
MTFAGKKLQDIYDSGSAQMSELEENSISKLASKSSEHVSERLESEQQSKMEVAAKAAAVEEEIKRQARETAERMKNAMESEKESTANHLRAMLERLTVFTGELKLAIAELKSSYQAGLDDNYQNASDYYSGTVEVAAQDIENQHYDSGQRLRSQSSFFANSLQQKLDHSLWESRGSEKQSNSQLFRNYMQKANGIESHFATLMQKLQDRFQEGFNQLEGFAGETEASLSDSTEDFNQKIDSVLTDIEKDINEIFASARDANRETLKDKFEGTREQVEDLSRDTAKQLKAEVGELTSKLSQSSLQSNHSLRKKCDEIKEKIQSDMQSFVGRMTENVTESETTRQQLAEAKARVISEIRADLVEIRDRFEENLRRMMQNATTDLQKMQDDVISDMNTAFSRSMLKIGSDSQSAREEIEEATEKLLSLIEKNRSQALSEISRAAGQ